MKHKGKSKNRSTLWWAGLILLIIAMTVFLWLVLQYDFTQDDAYITFRYAANYLGGHGLVYNIGERVEGYTNFLWLQWMIIGGLIGFDFVLLSKFLGVICGIGSIFVVFLLGRELFGKRSILPGITAIFLGCTYSFAYWSAAGLETAAFALAVSAAFYFYCRRSYLLPSVLIIAALLRPEGGLIFLFLVLFEIYQTRRIGSYALFTALVFILALVPYLIFKIAYFGDIFPNPFYAKTGLNWDKLRDGFEYIGLYGWHYLGAGLFLLPAFIFVRKIPGRLKALLIIIPVYALYIVAVGGDVLKVHRFFVPIMGPVLLMIVYGISHLCRKKMLILVVLAGVLAWQLVVPRGHVTDFHRAELGLAQKMNHMADDLLENDKTDFSLAVTTIGLIGYRLTGHTVIDMLGLTDRTIAKYPEPAVPGMQTSWKERKFNSRYILSKQPKYILFSTGLKPSAPAEKALMLYSEFLKNYRTIAFHSHGYIRYIFKKYRPVGVELNRDIDLRFVDNYQRAMQMVIEHDYPGAIESFEQASTYVPDSIFPYPKYYQADLLLSRVEGQIERAYEMMLDIASKDSTIFDVYRSLWFYEHGIRKDYARAAYYRSRLETLVPWFVGRLDSLLVEIDRR
ncbi:MAG: hypothetical protein DRP46_11780 [Candidatus Zixiibacteriota bacterium]|nr:MAG: hypothetical protein DRP46_11780 [candidate division Zixibacteria bacterium]